PRTSGTGARGPEAPRAPWGASLTMPRPSYSQWSPWRAQPGGPRGRPGGGRSAPLVARLGAGLVVSGALPPRALPPRALAPRALAPGRRAAPENPRQRTQSSATFFFIRAI